MAGFSGMFSRFLLPFLLTAAAGAAPLTPGEGPVAQATADMWRILGPAWPEGVAVEVVVSPLLAPPVFPGTRAPFDSFREGWSVKIIAETNKKRFCITGRDPESAAAGVYAFLRAATGVRWYGPAAWEEFVPPPARWKLPTQAELDRRPPFVSRQLSGLRTPDELLWARRVGLRQLLPSGHNLTNLFIPKDLVAHPEWLGHRDGTPVRPPARGYGWQVDFTHPATVAHASRRIGEWSAQQPETRVFSLGVNDTTAYPDEVLAAAGDRWFRRRPDLGTPVFAWTSEVARTRPDLWFTSLAYYYAENVPDGAVAPNVIPWLTSDRSAWSQPAFRAEDTALMARWTASGARIVGIYDYLYGFSHELPRCFEPALADSIPTAARLGVRAYYAELYPVWGFDGPKAFLAASLLDDPTSDPKMLLDNYFDHEFGPAAPAARRFWKRAAEAWSRAPGPVRWIKFYRDENQLAVLTDRDLRTLRSELDEMLTADVSDSQRLNIHRLAEAWEVTELAASLHRAWQAAATGATDWVSRRSELAKRLADPLFRTGPNRLMADATFLLNTEPVEAKAFELTPETGPGRPARLVFREGAVAALAGRNRVLDDPVPHSWRSFQTASRRTPDALLDQPSPDRLTFSGQESARLNLTLQVTPGELFAVGATARGRVGVSSPVAMEVQFLDAAGNPAGRRRERLFGAGKAGEWPLLIAARVPENAEWAVWSFVVEHQEPGDRLELSLPFSASGAW